MVNELEKISKVILFCNKMLEDFMEKAWDKDDLTKMVALSLYRDAIEGMDSLYILSDHGSQNAAGISYRHMFEVVLSLLYMIGDESKMKQRSESYYVSEQKFKIIEIKKLINNSNLKQDERESLKEKLLIFESSLKHKFIQSTLKEWENLKKEKKYKKYDPKWYSLFGGPTSIVGLIKHLSENDKILRTTFAVDGFQSFFENAYSTFSRTAHSYSSLDNYLALNTEGTIITLRPLRISTPEVLNGQFRIAESASIIVILTSVFILRLFPEYKENYINFLNDIVS